MGKRSLKASTRGTQIAKEAFEKKGWTQEQLAEAVGLSSRQSVWKFFTGRPIERHLFKEMCFQLDLTWEEIADLPQGEKPSTQEDQSINDLGVEGCVNLLRLQLHEQIQTQCNTLQSPIALTQPLLEQIYILTRIIPQPSNQRWLEVSDFQDSNASFERPILSHLNQEAVSGMDIIAQYERLMILGKPGAGKTTFVQYIALQSIGGYYRPDLVPFFFQLRTWSAEIPEEDNFNLLTIILRLGRRYNLSDEQTMTLLEEGKFLLLLDGLDEVSEEETEMIFQEVNQFLLTYYKNPIIITSRTGFQKYYFQGFTYVELADFNQNQIENFVHKWFVATANELSEGQKKAQQFLEQLALPYNQPIRELCVTPILLNLLCSVFKERANFPTKRAKLYQAGLDILLLRWDQARGIHRDQIYRYLALSDKIKLLSQIAAKTFEEGNYFFESSELLPIIEDYLRNLPNANLDVEILWLNSEAVLKSIEFQHGLLIERARDVYSFSHLSFQEYLTARKITLTSPGECLKQELEKLANHTTDYRWREVILLTASMLPKADFLIEKMKEKINCMLQKNAGLQEFLSIIQEKVQNLNLPYGLSATRAFYFTLLQNRDFNLAISLDKKFVSLKNFDASLDLDYSLARAFTDSINLVNQPDRKKFINLSLSLDLESKFALEPNFKQSLKQLKELLPDPEQGKENIQMWWQTEGKNWVQQFRQILFKYRQIGYDWQLSAEQKEAAQQYYRANEFLIECLNSDCQVSSTLRKNIEENILLPI
ncbi:NACHT domain-containing protein [Gloeothece verrucosa]|uniref:Transcriptional regulator, XRE family n=1 Tax=Gloeothece verrucosa (strain PCC 7822) TaxID=497965 RepID=E0UEL5_GLOV7|nr:NACHT domain-containing NTPase [Gloeothece verrucosa]ADN16583.1 transcriptional regulator, XRE family [Gloeothece verrucosa PCC 7822]